MGINSYGHIGGIESGHATYIEGVNLAETATRRSVFVPWTTHHNVAWVKMPKGTTAWDMVAKNVNLNCEITAENLADIIDPKHAADLADEHVALVRTSPWGDRRILGMRKGEGLLNNRDVAAMIDVFVEAAQMNGHDATPVTAFELDMGKRFAVCAKLGSSEWFGGTLGGLVTAVTSRDGRWNSKVIESVVVSECTNTLSMNLLAASERKRNGTDAGHLIAFRNTSRVAARWDEAQAAVYAIAGKFALFGENARRLASTPITDGDFHNVLMKVMGEKPEPRAQGKKGIDPAKTWEAKKFGIIEEYFAAHNDYCFGTAWGALMAANGYELHTQPSRLDRVYRTMDSLYSETHPITDAMLHALIEATEVPLLVAK